MEFITFYVKELLHQLVEYNGNEITSELTLTLEALRGFDLVTVWAIAETMHELNTNDLTVAQTARFCELLIGKIEGMS